MIRIISIVFALNWLLPTMQINAAANNKGIIEMKELTVFINGNKVSFDVPPALKNDRTLVPIRAIFEAMGAEVNWDSTNQTVLAIKEGTSIKLVINSKIAKINGIDSSQLDVPATLYKDRTLVPLRFVGEAFGGTVDWNEKSKNVNITLSDSNSDSSNLIEYQQISLNDKQLDFGENTPILRNNVVYIPIAPFLENLVGDVYWNRNGDMLQTQVDGKSIDFYIGQNYINVDGKTKETNESPVEHNGMFYVSLNTIVKYIGVKSHYSSSNKEIKIYITRDKFQHEFLTKEQVEFSKPTNVTNTQFVGNRRIMVSDNPENLNGRTVPDVNATLWHDEVKSGDSAQDHRVFGWHINEFDQDVTIGLTIENLSTTNEIEIVGVKGAHRKSPNTWVNYDVGLPLAEYVLSDKMTNVKMNSSSIKAGEATLMKQLEVQKSFTVGFSYDFTVKRKSGSGELNYKIRTVISKNGTDLSTILTDPVDIDQTARHPRGVWTSSQLETNLPRYEAGSDDVSFQISNGATDNIMSVETGIGNQGEMVRNPGHFGASYKVNIPIVNETGDSKTVRVRLGARGGIYNGAIKLNGKVYLTQTLTPMTEVANVVDYEIPDNSVNLIALEIMHAGGSALPLAIELVTLD